MDNLIKYKTDPKKNGNCNIFSIVIPTYNEERYIAGLLERILDFNTDGFQIEIIIVDNGSCDNTVAIVRKYPCKCFILPDATIAEMRNYGAKNAQGEWIGFVDADCMPVKNWAILAKNQLERNSRVGIIGSYYSLSLKPTWVEKLWCSMRHETVGRVNFLPAGNMAVRLKDFLHFGGFPEHLITGEDYALCQIYNRKGFLVVNDPMLKSIHFGNPRTLNDIFKKEMWYGLSCKQSIKENFKAKVFWFTCVYLVGVLWSIIALLMQYITNFTFFKNIAILGVLLVGFVVISYSVIATIRARKAFYFGGYIFLFFFYFLGRSVSIVKILANKVSCSGWCKLH